MEKALSEGRATGRLEYSDKSRVSKWRVFNAHANDVSFMHKSNFNQWLKDERVILLQPQSLRVVNSFCETYTTSTVGYGSDSESE